MRRVPGLDWPGARRRDLSFSQPYPTCRPRHAQSWRAGRARSTRKIAEVCTLNEADGRRSARVFLKVVEHKQANGGREIPRLSGLVDIRDQIREAALLRGGNILQRIPELCFGTNARLMTRYDDRSFEYGRLHELLQ